MSSDLPFHVARTVIIRAQPATVFRFFTDSELFASWWGKGSRIEARPGGEVHIVYPGGVTAGGEVVALTPDRSITFTYGYDDPAKPIRRGTSRVTIDLAPHAEGTQVSLRHDVISAEIAEQHVPGWTYQLSLFANVVAAQQHRDATAIVDRFFALWSQADAAARAAELGKVVTDDVEFRDPYAAIKGRADLEQHFVALQRHMPNTKLVREGAVKQCQGTALVAWSAGTARGQNVFRFSSDGRIADVVGLWG